MIILKQRLSHFKSALPLYVEIQLTTTIRR
jgi:hypothetical protein